MKQGNLYVAGPFDASEVRQVEARFSAMLGRDISLRVIRDEKLIGGFLATVDGTVYDASVLARIQSIRRHIISREDAGEDD